MVWFVQAFITGITAFVATNIDDIVVLMLFFSQVNANFRTRHIVTGQYLGFCVLLAASLPGYFGGLVLPHQWIRVLGILPIAVGIHHLLQRDEDESDIQTVALQENRSRSLGGFLAPQTYQVAAVTVANGGDNIGIYVPLFADSRFAELGVLLGVFFAMIGLWCGVAYWLARHPAIAPLVTRYGHKIVPFVLIGLGILILLG